MAQTDKNNDLMNEDKLKPEMEALADEILQKNKNVKEVEIEANIETKTTRTGEKSEKGGSGPLGRPENMGGIGKPGSMGPIGQSEKASGGEQDGKNKGGDGEKQPKEESDKKEPGGKQPAEANQPKEKPGPSAGSPRQGSGQAGQDGEAGGGKADKEGGEKGEEAGEKKSKEEPGRGQMLTQKPTVVSDMLKRRQARSKEDNDKLKGGAVARAGDEYRRRRQAERLGLRDVSGQAEEKKDWQPGGRTKESDDLDSELLNPRQEGTAAGKLREKKKNKDGEDGGEPQSLRQRVMAARQAMNLKEQAKKKLEEKALAPAKQGTSYLLKAAWLNVIDSFGLTLIWINIHVFLRWTLGDKLFCKLGEEWLPKQATMAGGEAAETAGKGIGLLEVIVLLIVDLIILGVILGSLAIIVMIVSFMDKSIWGKLGDIWDAFWALGWSGISTLSDLFKNFKY